MVDNEEVMDQLNEEADIAADYLEGLLDIIDYDGDIEMGVRSNRPVVQIVAADDRDIKHLVGRDGEVVEALQQLTRLAVQQKTGERSHLILDVNGYLRRKRQEIRDIALDAVDEAKATGDVIELEPMNSFERKLVHDIVREEGLKSRSRGEEPSRYVTVYVQQNKQDASFEEYEDSEDLDDAADFEHDDDDRGGTSRDVELEEVVFIDVEDADRDDEYDDDDYEDDEYDDDEYDESDDEDDFDDSDAYDEVDVDDDTDADFDDDDYDEDDEDFDDDLD